jgi:hypothetical protein
MSTNSKENTEKKDDDVAAKNTDLENLRGEVNILKKFIGNKEVKNANIESDVKSVKKYVKDKTEKETKAALEKKKLSKNIKGLGALAGLQPGLGQQSFKK